MLHWSLPMGNVHQNYADSIFEVASHRLGLQVPAPQVRLIKVKTYTKEPPPDR